MGIKHATSIIVENTKNPEYERIVLISPHKTKTF